MANLIYKVHPRHASKATLITAIAGKSVNLAGKPTVRVHEATATTDKWEEPIAAATQADLKAVYERGDKDAGGFPLVIAEQSSSASTDKK